MVGNGAISLGCLTGQGLRTRSNDDYQFNYIIEPNYGNRRELIPADRAAPRGLYFRGRGHDAATYNAIRNRPWGSSILFVTTTSTGLRPSKTPRPARPADTRLRYSITNSFFQLWRQVPAE